MFNLFFIYCSEFVIELVRVDFFIDDFQVMDSQIEFVVDVDYGVYYCGIIKGEFGFIVFLSIFEDGVMGLFSLVRGGNFVFGQLEGNCNEICYILYNDKDVLECMVYDCGMFDDGEGYIWEELQLQFGIWVFSDCVCFYYEVDYDIF